MAVREVSQFWLKLSSEKLIEKMSFRWCWQMFDIEWMVSTTFKTFYGGTSDWVTGVWTQKVRTPWACYVLKKGCLNLRTRMLTSYNISHNDVLSIGDTKLWTRSSLIMVSECDLLNREQDCWNITPIGGLIVHMI